MNQIHPTALVDDGVVLGDNNIIHAYSVLHGPLIIGDSNHIGPHATIGTPGQDTRDRYYDSSASSIEIGNRTIIREFVTIQKPVYEDLTKIGSDVFLMSHVHIPHDAILEDEVTVAPMSVIAGLAKILRGATLSAGVSVHQHSVVGQYSIVGMGAAVTKNVRPFTRFVPGRPPSLNEYAIDKFGFQQHRDEIEAFSFRGVKPLTPSLVRLIDHYERLHLASGRAEH